MHHTNLGPQCPSCENKLLRADHRLWDWFRFVKEKHSNTHISWSFRDEETQDRLYYEGESKLKYPASGHNAVNSDGAPCSRALDIFQQDDDGIGIYNPKFMASICDESKEAGYHLLWGGVWKTLGDYCHFELSHEWP